MEVRTQERKTDQITFEEKVLGHEIALDRIGFSELAIDFYAFFGKMPKEFDNLEEDRKIETVLKFSFWNYFYKAIPLVDISDQYKRDNDLFGSRKQSRDISYLKYFKIVLDRFLSSSAEKENFNKWLNRKAVDENFQAHLQDYLNAEDFYNNDIGEKDSVPEFLSDFIVGILWSQFYQAVRTELILLESEHMKKSRTKKESKANENVQGHH